MSDVTCSHCAEPWNVYGLRHDSIAYLDTHEGDKLEPLEPVADIVSYLATTGGESDTHIATHLAQIGDGTPLTLPALFDYWWSTYLPDDNEPVSAAVKRVVETAIYRGVLSGKGCPSCGFDHPARGAHRDRTARELVFGGITDEDPVQYLD